MGIYSAIVKVDPVFAVLSKGIIDKSTIVTMVVFDGDAHICSFSFKCSTCIDSGFAREVTDQRQLLPRIVL